MLKHYISRLNFVKRKIFKLVFIRKRLVREKSEKLAQPFRFQGMTQEKGLLPVGQDEKEVILNPVSNDKVCSLDWKNAYGMV